MQYNSRSIFGLLLCVIGVTECATGEDRIRFNRDIRPILSERCFQCHGPDASQRKADLRFDTQEGIVQAFRSKGGKHGEALKRIESSDDDERMPPPEAGQLTSKEKQRIQAWVKQGANWEGHWAFIVPQRPNVPLVNGKTVHPIDAFIDRKLQQNRLTATGRADRATLLRRLSFDLRGVPPQPAEVRRFLADQRPDAFARRIEDWLASPKFGERMAVYWLDLVRYADSVGYHKDSHRDCWMFRDYVVDAFNQNKPFDQFVTEQLAGDLLDGDRFSKYRYQIASGFNRMIQTTSEGGAQAKEYLAKYSADRVRNTAAIFLGTTMGCSECHDHKYDPFTSKDFYSFAAFFADIKERGVAYPTHTQMPSTKAIARWEATDSKIGKLKKQLQSDPKNTQLTAQIQRLEAEIKQISNSKKWSKTLITLTAKPRTIRLLPRGNWLDDSGPAMSPAVPGFLGSLEVRDRNATRLDLANWIVSRKNPLTSRVFVNRVWKLFFGDGISRTLDDLGSQGDWPSHPELLDWLAVEFIESGWDVKQLVRLIVTSEAYARSSVATDQLLRMDPENRLLARQATYRLTAEFIRDNALRMSGLLSNKMSGPSVRPYQPKNYWYRLYKDAKYNTSTGEDQFRRGLYSYWRRSFWHPSLRAFDAPAREECVAKRPRSNTPQQSLVLLNDPTYVEAARVFAIRVIRVGGVSDSSRISFAFETATSRKPTPNETKLCLQLLEHQRKRYLADPKAVEDLLSVGTLPIPSSIARHELAAWSAVTRTIMNLHETITRN